MPGARGSTCTSRRWWRVRVTLAGRAHHEVRTFATTAADLRALHEWLVAAGCTHAVLESTGVYWKGHAGAARTDAE
jgi:hypothetical protein